jgi:hypothetical protein
MDLCPAQAVAPTLLVIVGISAEVYVSRRTIYMCIHLANPHQSSALGYKYGLATSRNAQTP